MTIFLRIIYTVLMWEYTAHVCIILILLIIIRAMYRSMKDDSD